MICYRDRTYCIAQCGNDECSRKLTEQVMDDADDFGLPLAMADLSENCDKYEEKVDDLHNAG